MSMMNAIAAASMSISDMQLQQGISISVAKKAMESQQVALEAIQEMLPPTQNLLDVKV